MPSGAERGRASMPAAVPSSTAAFHDVASARHIRGGLLRRGLFVCHVSSNTSLPRKMAVSCKFTASEQLNRVNWRRVRIRRAQKYPGAPLRNQHGLDFLETDTRAESCLWSPSGRGNKAYWTQPAWTRRPGTQRPPNRWSKGMPIGTQRQKQLSTEIPYQDPRNGREQSVYEAIDVES